MVKSAKMTGGIWGVITGVVAFAAGKTILDTIRPDAADNLLWAGVGGVATGLVMATLTGSGVLGLNIYKGILVTERSK